LEETDFDFLTREGLEPSIECLIPLSESLLWLLRSLSALLFVLFRDLDLLLGDVRIDGPLEGEVGKAKEIPFEFEGSLESGVLDEPNSEECLDCCD